MVIKMIVELSKREIECKVVYFGCAMSGKTTSLKHIFGTHGRLEDLKSIETDAGRTLFWDHGYITLNSSDWKIKMNLWSATGQDFYANTRPTILTGADGIVFVADSSPELTQFNRESWLELMGLITNVPKKIPIVISLNKRDDPKAVSLELFKASLNLDEKRLKSIEIYETTATRGINVTVCLKRVLEKILAS